MVGGGNKEPWKGDMKSPFHKWLWSDPDERERLFSPMQNRRYAARAANLINKVKRSTHFKMTLRNIWTTLFVKPINRLRKPQAIVWYPDYGGEYPGCPRCTEPAYDPDRCCFCGQRYYYKPTKKEGDSN